VTRTLKNELGPSPLQTKKFRQSLDFSNSLAEGGGEDRLDNQE
jgi:hypothetical protein